MSLVALNRRTLNAPQSTNEFQHTPSPPFIPSWSDTSLEELDSSGVSASAWQGEGTIVLPFPCNPKD